MLQLDLTLINNSNNSADGMSPRKWWLPAGAAAMATHLSYLRVAITLFVTQAAPQDCAGTLFAVSKHLPSGRRDPESEGELDEEAVEVETCLFHVAAETTHNHQRGSQGVCLSHTSGRLATQPGGQKITLQKSAPMETGFLLYVLLSWSE